MRPWAVLAAAALGAAGVLLLARGTGVDAEQARICRIALPALNPEGVRITVLSARPGREDGTVRIDYQVERTDRTPLPRHAVCRFAASGLRAGKQELVGIATERGPIPGSSLYLLKRFYIESPEGVSNDPGLGRRSEGLREIPAPLAYTLQQLLAGLPGTAIYGLLASAFSLVFGLVGRLNLAFGELAAVGAAGTVAGVGFMGLAANAAPLSSLAVGLLVAAFAGAAHGMAGGWITVGRIRDVQPSLIATVGLSLALMEYLRLAQSPVAVWIPPVWSGAVPLARSGEFVVTVTPVSLLVAGTGLLAAAALLHLLGRSRYGRAWRAYSDDPRAAELCGVDGARLLLLTLALAGALAALAGTLVVVQFGGLGFAGGFGLGLKALIAAVLGGVGSVPGALAGGLLIGLFETIWQAFLPIDGRDIALFAVLVLVLVLRPGGLMGLRAPSPREV